MKQLRITTNNARGEKALKQAMKDGRKEKAALRMMFSIDEKKDPYTIILTLRNNPYAEYFHLKNFSPIIHTAMHDNGAARSDYEVSVHE